MKYAIVKILPEKAFTWSQLAAAYLEHAKSYMAKSSLGGPRYVIDSFTAIVGAKQLDAIDRADMDRWNAWVTTYYKSTNSQRVRISILRSIFKFAMEEGMIAQNPARRLRLPQPHSAGRALTDSEIARFIGSLTCEKVRRAIMFLLYTGLRPGELRSLRWWQIRDSHVFLPAALTKKKYDRNVELSPKAKEYLGPRGGNEDRVFCVAPRTLYRYKKAALAAADIGRARLYDMRHTWATKFLEAAKDPVAVMVMGGWKDWNAMKVYQHLLATRRKAIFEVSYPV